MIREADTGQATKKKAWKKTSKLNIAQIDVDINEKVKPDKRKRTRHKSPSLNDDSSHDSAISTNVDIFSQSLTRRDLYKRQSLSQSETSHYSPPEECFTENNNRDEEDITPPATLLRKFRKHSKVSSASVAISPQTNGTPTKDLFSPDIETR